jgi:hypothetical protein
MNGLRILAAGGVAAAIACTSMAAHADEESGVSVGVRAGYAIPFGNAESGVTMNALQHGMIPAWFDAGYRINRKIFIGAFYQYGVTLPLTNSCSFPPSVPGALVATAQGKAGQTTCDGRDQRFGLEVAYHIRPKEQIDPWIGLGLGWEFTTLDYSTGAAAAVSSYQMSGFSADLQLGADLRFSKVVPFGPFIDVSLSSFGTASYYDANGVGYGPETFSSSVHGWVTLGARVQFDL